MRIALLLGSLNFIFAVVAGSAAVATPFPSGTKALLIIDMQDVFVTRFDFEAKDENPEKLQSIIENQKSMIALAKAKHMPIMVVAYANNGPTKPELMQAIGDYPATFQITKTSDGLFDPSNASVEQAKSKLSEWGIKDLILVGANGGACVEATMEGALLAGYRVWTYTAGIADFNYINFIYPYFYEQNLDDFQVWVAKGLKEYDKPIQFVDFRFRKKPVLPPPTVQPPAPIQMPLQMSPTPGPLF